MTDTESELQLPYIVQRLSTQDMPNMTGFDKYFRLEYMGSSEYEWGTPKASLDHLRSSTPLIKRECIITIDGITRSVWVVASEQDMDDSITVLKLWCDPSRPRAFRGKEYSWFPEAFKDTLPDYMDTIAWWDFRLHFAWALDEKTASTLLTAFLEKPASRA